MTSHTCRAVRCVKLIPMDMLMCAKHWRMVPLALRREVWREYRRWKAGATSMTAAYADAVQAEGIVNHNDLLQGVGL